MNARTHRGARVVCFGVAALLSCWSPPAGAEILLRDDFDDTSGPTAAQGDGIVNVAAFRAPFGGADFVGRTQFRFDLPAENVAQTGVGGVGSPTGSTDGKVAVLTLDTYNPLDPGDAFYGTDLITKRNFTVGGGLRVESRMRIDAGTPGGLVASPFLYDVSRESPPGTLVRDEIDHEIITNFAQSAAPDQTFTNVWNDGDFASAGAGAFIANPAGFDVTRFHNYRTDWVGNKVQYYIDGTLVRTETGVVPDDPMQVHHNFWAPGSDFVAAYNAALQPSATQPGATYRAEVDWTQVERFNTTTSANLLVDGSFEAFPLATPASNGTGGWTLFENASQDGFGVLPQNGDFALKTFGPFSGGSGASGAFQNVAAAPGQQFEGSIWAYAPSGDSILGQTNFTNITLQFVNAGGAVIGSVMFSPGANAQDTPIFDGRDANMIQDEWVQYTVDAVAPAATAFVRFNAFFVQVVDPTAGPGAVFFDNASLVRLTPTTTYALSDLNLDGAVNGVDFATWKGAFGTSAAADVTGDQRSAGDDFLAWQRQFTGVGAATAIPEPTAGGLLLTVAAAGRRWRRNRGAGVVARARR